jgi:hypothetical protein
MDEGSRVLAIVDEVDNVPVVWWVDLGPKIAGMTRLCGAWVLDDEERAQSLHALVAARVTVTTSAGARLLADRQIETSQVLDLAATLADVSGERDRLQAAYEEAVATRENGRALTAPRWPALPAPLDSEAAEEFHGGDARTRRALGIARWLAGLCTAWDAVEEQRLARGYMRPLGGPAARALPVVLAVAESSVAA